MAHPDTYLNKVVIGGGDGRMLLYNFKTGRLLYEFSGVCSSAVKCIVSSPALDIVGVGDADGCVPGCHGLCIRNGVATLHSNMTLPACGEASVRERICIQGSGPVLFRAELG